MFSYQLIAYCSCIYIWTKAVALASGELSLDNSNSFDATQGLSPYPLGDVRRCMATLGKGVQRFEVLPGGGWDNLQNKDMGMVSFMNFSLCKTTDDGKFLIPDCIQIIPIKTSRVETFAEMIEHWTDYTSVTSRGINVHSGLQFPNIGISGSFSSDYKHVKERQYYDKSMTTRIQLRYVRYEAKLQPDTPYLKVFRDRLNKIAAHIMLNRTHLAHYESQLLVRDFGTHLVTSVDVGAALVQLDQVQAEFVRNHESDMSAIKAAASAKFYKVFDFGVSYSQSTSNTMIDQYKNSTTSSHIDTIGGPVFKPLNYTANTWTDSIDSNMVALDRSGDPIFYSINEQTLPDIPASTVYQVYKYVRAAVEQYYKHNMYHGCTNPDSPNFIFQANVNDGTCQPPETNYTFGGMFQKCSGYDELCTQRVQKNPLTGDYSCASGYDEILLHTDTKSATKSRRSCHKCWLLFHCCHDEAYTVTATYTTYWCAAQGTVSQDNGFLFGGLYNPMINNPMTMAKTCPPKFYGLKLLDDMIVCVSDDYELGFRYSLPFAGFFSCHSGNPLALKKTVGLNSSRTNSLQSFMLQAGSGGYPRECPKGYSQHLAIIDNSCEIYFCMQYGSLSPHGLPNVQRPPYMGAPNSRLTDKNTHNDTVVLNDQGTLWMSMTEAENKFGQSDNTNYLISNTDKQILIQHGSTKSSENGLSVGGVAAIIVSVLACIGITLAIVVIVIRSRRRRSYRETDTWSNGGADCQRRGYGGAYNTMETSIAVAQT